MFRLPNLVKKNKEKKKIVSIVEFMAKIYFGTDRSTFFGDTTIFIMHFYTKNVIENKRNYRYDSSRG